MSWRQGEGRQSLMEFGVAIPSSRSWADAGRIREAIAAAENLGFHTAWFSDHIVIPGYAADLMAPSWYDPISCMLVGIGSTQRIRLGTDVLVAPYRNPVVLSQILASADQLSDGRLTIAVGVGYLSGEFAALNAPYEERGAVTDEYLQVMSLLWESPDLPVSFAGRWVSFEDVYASPPPQQDPFPIWVGGNIAAARRRAAGLGRGWHPLFPTPEQYARGKAEIEAARAAAGLNGPFTFSLSTAKVSVELEAKSPAGFAGYAGDTEIPSEFGYAPAPPIDASGRLRFVGTPDQLIDDVRAYAVAGVEHITLRFWVGEDDFGVPEFLEQLERFALHVAPQVG